MADLLFLAHRIPFPPDKGDKIRSWNMLAHLARRYRVHLGCLVDDPADLKHLDALRAVCESVGAFPIAPRPQRARALVRLRPGRTLTEGYFFDPRLVRWIRETVAARLIAQTVVFSSGMAAYADALPPGLRILDMVDVDSEKWRELGQTTRGPMGLVYRREARTLLALERRLVGRFDRTLFVTEAEAARFLALAPECRDRVGWMGNGVDLGYFAPDPALGDPLGADRPTLVFTGAMDYAANVDAVAWFADAVLPLLKDAGNPLFAIVGSNPTEAVRRLAGPDIVVTGRVPDTRPYLQHATCVVAPLRIARGIQNKVLEGMAMARPVVATPQAFEGIEAEPGRHLLVAEGAPAMAAAIRTVLAGADPALGGRARAQVEGRYSWSEKLATLDRLLAVNDERAGPPAARAVRATA